MTPDLDLIRRKVRAAMRQHGISQRKLAADAGVTQGAVSQWLSGRIDLTGATLAAVCRAAGLRLDADQGNPQFSQNYQIHST